MTLISHNFYAQNYFNSFELFISNFKLVENPQWAGRKFIEPDSGIRVFFVKNLYTFIFETYGVTDYSLSLISRIFKHRLYTYIDLKAYEAMANINTNLC